MVLVALLSLVPIMQDQSGLGVGEVRVELVRDLAVGILDEGALELGLLGLGPALEDGLADRDRRAALGRDHPAGDLLGERAELGEALGLAGRVTARVGAL